MSKFTKTADKSPTDAFGVWGDTFPETTPDFFDALPQRKVQEEPLSGRTDPLEKEEYSWTEWPQDSTVLREFSEKIDQEIERLFEVAKEQVFEDGMESDFSKELVSLVKKYNDPAVTVITRLIVTEQANAEVASEALRWVGRMEHSITHQSRLFLLERSLYSRSARIRDGAALGLASLDNPHAIPHLRRAIQREKYKRLRRCLEQVLFQLENTH